MPDRYPGIAGLFRLVDTLCFTAEYGEEEQTIMEIFCAIHEPNLYRCIVWVEEMFKCEPSFFTQEQRDRLGGLPDHSFLVNQTALRFAPEFEPDGFAASNDAEALQKAFHAYCFHLDHSMGRCMPEGDHTLSECEGGPSKKSGP